MACGVIWLLPGHAYAQGSVVTIPGGSFTDGQTITVSGTGFPVHSALPGGLQIIECSDPGGLVANLPMDAATGCDGTTVNGGQINTDATGAFSATYGISALSSTGNSSINCDSTDFCVLWVGQDYNGAFLSGPHAFSGAFEITSTTTTTTTTMPTTTTTMPTTTTTMPTTTTTTGATTTTTTPPTLTCASSTGCSLPISGTGFQAGESVDLVLHSNPVDLGTVTADGSGNFTDTVKIPAGTDPGAHTIVATGATSGNTESFPLTVTGTAVALTGKYELFCVIPTIGNVVLNDTVTTAAITPTTASATFPSSGQTFNVTGYQTVVTVPAALATVALAISPNLMGSTTATVDALGATPATTGQLPAVSFNVPIPTQPAAVTLSLPSTPETVPTLFTATGAGITIQEHSAAGLSLTVSGMPLALTCNAYPNDTIATSGITTATPGAATISPVIAVAGAAPPATPAPPAAPQSTTTTATPVVKASSASLAFTGPGPGIGVLGIIGGALILLGFALFALVDAPRRAIARLVVLGPTTWRRVRAGDQGWEHLTSQIPIKGRQLTHSGMRVAKQTAAWLLGR